MHSLYKVATEDVPALQLCRECFYHNFEEEIHKTIIDNKLFKRSERVAVGASGAVFTPAPQQCRDEVPTSMNNHVCL